MPVSASTARRPAGSRSIFTPSASSMSAAPLLDDMERLPCLATGTPAAATTKDTAVEILSVPGRRRRCRTDRSPRAGRVDGLHLARIAAPRRRSPTSGLRAARAIRKAAIPCLADAPAMMVAEDLRGLRRRPECSPPPRRFRARRNPRRSCRHGEVARDGRKLPQQGMAVLRRDAFGMELHAMHRMGLVHHALDHAVVAGGGDLQARPACCRGAMVRE